MKNIILLLVSISLGFMGISQVASLGLQGAGFLNIIRSSESMHHFGYGGGINAYIPINERMGIRPEINFQMRRFLENEAESFSMGNTNFDYEYTERTTFRFIEMPVLFVYKLTDRLSIYLGPQYGLNYALRYQIDERLSYISRTTGENITEDQTYLMERTDTDLQEFSLVAGPSFYFDFGMSLELRAQQSLALFGKDADDYNSWTLVQALIRYNFPLSKKVK